MAITPLMDCELGVPGRQSVTDNFRLRESPDFRSLAGVILSDAESIPLWTRKLLA
jgi:hypothetical protein